MITAANGQAGLELALERRPAAIVMDANMPVMDGFEAVKRLRKHRQTAAIPVVMLTMRSRQGDVLAGYRFGVQEYLTKPVTIEKVLNSVRTVLAKSR